MNTIIGKKFRAFIKLSEDKEMQPMDVEIIDKIISNNETKYVVVVSEINGKKDVVFTIQPDNLFHIYRDETTTYFK